MQNTISSTKSTKSRARRASHEDITITTCCRNESFKLTFRYNDAPRKLSRIVLRDSMLAELERAHASAREEIRRMCQVKHVK